MQLTLPILKDINGCAQCDETFFFFVFSRCFMEKVQFLLPKPPAKLKKKKNKILKLFLLYIHYRIYTRNGNFSFLLKSLNDMKTHSTYFRKDNLKQIRSQSIKWWRGRKWVIQILEKTFKFFLLNVCNQYKISLGERGMQSNESVF